MVISTQILIPGGSTGGMEENQHSDFKLASLRKYTSCVSFF